MAAFVGKVFVGFEKREPVKLKCNQNGIPHAQA